MCEEFSIKLFSVSEDSFKILSSFINFTKFKGDNCLIYKIIIF